MIESGARNSCQWTPEHYFSIDGIRLIHKTRDRTSLYMPNTFYFRLNLKLYVQIWVFVLLTKWSLIQRCYNINYNVTTRLIHYKVVYWGKATLVMVSTCVCLLSTPLQQNWWQPGVIHWLARTHSLLPRWILHSSSNERYTDQVNNHFTSITLPLKFGCISQTSLIYTRLTHT